MQTCLAVVLTSVQLSSMTSSSSVRFFILFLTGIEVWPLWDHERLFKMPIGTAERGLCVAVSEAANLVVSGHLDGTVRR